MSMAKSVAEVEPKELVWLSVVDEEGRIWRYGRRGITTQDVPAHIEGRYFGRSTTIRVVLVRGHDGRPVLRQDGPGLPKRIVVNYSPPATKDAPVALATCPQGKIEYERECDTPAAGS